MVLVFWRASAVAWVPTQSANHELAGAVCGVSRATAGCALAACGGFRIDHAVVDHGVEHGRRPRLRLLGMGQRIVLGRRLDQAGQHGGLGERHVRPAAC